MVSLYDWIVEQAASKHNELTMKSKGPLLESSSISLLLTSQGITSLMADLALSAMSCGLQEIFSSLIYELDNLDNI